MNLSSTRTAVRLAKIPAIALAFCLSSLSFAAEAPLNPAGFVIQRGVNLSHWLSQDFGWNPREELITENDIRYIAGIGYDHVRLPLDEKEMWLEDGTPNEESFALVKDALEWCRKNDLRVIIDLHTINAHHFNAVNEGLKNTLWNDPAAQQHFFDLWAQLSERFASYPVDQVAYEIMNEPVADNNEDWNSLVERTLKQIRASEPNRVVVVGSNRWQIPESFGDLKVPEGDKNIILSTHVYSPFIFTHYTADWTPLKDYTGPVNYPGRVLQEEDYQRLMAANGGSLKDLVQDSNLEWNKEQIKNKFKPAIDRARELGLQLYCGEFGCLPTAPREGRLQYYADITDAMEESGMAWANWEYKGDFGIFEWHRGSVSIGAPDLEIIERLVGD